MTNDQEAYILAHEYKFAPLPDGFYEIDTCADPTYKWMRLAFGDNRTRCLFKYDPTELIPPE